MEFSPVTPREENLLVLKISSSEIFFVPVCENKEMVEMKSRREINCFIRISFFYKRKRNWFIGVPKIKIIGRK
jgi:hypothetical protein